MAPSEGPQSPVLSLSPQPSVSAKTNQSPTPIDQHKRKPSHPCPNCLNHSQQIQCFERRVARLRMRLRDSIETTQTHGQRLLRAAFQDKLRQITVEHAQRTTEMLNVQKKCFDGELEHMEIESQSAIQAVQKQLDDQRLDTDKLVFRYECERDDTLEKTQSTMQAVQRKLTHIQENAARLEHEKNQLAAAHHHKQLMIEVLASTAAAKDVERRRLVVLENGQEEERKRKNSLIDSLQGEIADLRKQLQLQTDQNQNMTSKVVRLEKELRDMSQRHATELEDLRQGSKTEIDRMGRLFASMIEDFAQVPSEPATTG